MAQGQVLTYKNWKALQILESEQALKRANGAPKSENQADLLYQALLKLELSKDLTVNDYFIVYLSRHHDGKSAILKAAKKMSPEETASLLLAYRSNLQEKPEASSNTRPEIPPTSVVEALPVDASVGAATNTSSGTSTSTGGNTTKPQ